MALSANQRASVINDLVANCEMWQGYGDREILDSFPDDKLIQLRDLAMDAQRAVAVANAAVAGFSDSGTAYRVNPETGQWEKRVVGNAGRMAGCDEEDDPNEEEPDEDEDDQYVERTNRRRMTGNRGSVPRRFQTADEMLRSLPSDMQETIRVAQEIEQREKDNLISQILTNSAIPDTDKQAHYERLQRRTVEELRNDLALLPKMPKPEDLEGRRRPLANRSRGGDMLDIPSLDWDGSTLNQSGEEGGEDYDGVGNVGFEAGDFGSEEEFLRSAPPRLRAMMQNAMAIEGREKQKLIEQLVSNVDDEDAARRLASRLRSKTLEELNDMALAWGGRGGFRRPSYFGAATPATANTRHPETEDVLMPPSMDWGSDS